jgi:hypothetical protein
MELDRFDVIGFLVWSAFLVIMGIDASSIWFLQFGWLATCWFGRALIDHWLDDKPA